MPEKSVRETGLDQGALGTHVDPLLEQYLQALDEYTSAQRALQAHLSAVRCVVPHFIDWAWATPTILLLSPM